MSGKRKRKLKPIISAAHKEKNPKMTMECEICRSKFSTKIILMQHIQLMHLETRQKFPCQICNTILLSEKDLKTHISLVHEEKKPFKCGMCKSKFSENKSLNRHMVLMHKAEKSIVKCKVCHAVFTELDDLKRHLASAHEGKFVKAESSESTKKSKLGYNIKDLKKWFECKLCSKKFESNLKLEKHVKVVHKGMNLKRVFEGKGENSGSDIEDNDNSVEFATKTNKIQRLEMANDEAKKKLDKAASSNKALEESKDLNDKKVQIQNFTYAIEGAMLRWDLKEFLKVVPVNNTESFDTMELEKMENQLQTEAALNKSLKESLSRYRKSKQVFEDKGENSGSDYEDQSKGDTKDNCAEKNSKIQAIAIENGDAKNMLEALEESNIKHSENYNSCVECEGKNSKIQALEIANDEEKNKLKTEVASAKKALEESKANAKVELEKVENQLQTEVASVKKALEESKANAKVELEKVENQLQNEVASNKSLEESLSRYRILNQDAKNKLEAMEELSNKFRKISQDWAIKVYQSNPSNEDLAKLLSLEPKKLFKKYEQISKFNESNMVKVEEIDYAMKEKKLNLQILQRELYEKELDKIMDVLKMPFGDRNYTNVLPMIKDLLQQVDTDHYTNVVENIINE